MYLLVYAKYSGFVLCDYHIDFLASELYLEEASLSTLQKRINLLWDHRRNTDLLVNFMQSHEAWFYEEFLS